MGMDVRQILEHAISPTLRAMALAHGKDAMASDAATALMLGTGMHESAGYRYVQQLGGGPAMGFWQVEPATAQWLDSLLRGSSYSGLRSYFEDLGGAAIEERRRAMRWNLRLACAYARFRFWVVPDALPEADDVQGLAFYWKQHYNTPSGAGTVEQWAQAYREALSRL